MTQPPQDAIDAAIASATRSPCAKSRRGATLFRVGGLDLISSDNAPPPGFACQEPCGPNACREVCIHAEQAAIVAALYVVRRLSDFELLHVKIDDRGKLVAGGGPSCPQCSKLVVYVNLTGVWLYESVLDSVGYATGNVWKHYTAAQFHQATLRNRGLMRKCGKHLGDNDGTCPQLTCIRDANHKGNCDNVRS